MESQEAARQLLRDAAKRMVEAEWEEAVATAKLATVPLTASTQEVDELIAVAHAAHAARIRAQLHWANCRALMRQAWEAAQGEVRNG
jgi:hypothetical protein